MRRLRERGQSTIILALSITVLLAAVGLSADFGNLTVQKSRLQKGVDNAALAIAQDCALSKPTCAAPAPTATALVNENANPDSVAAPAIDMANKTVTVTASEGVQMALGRLIGVDDKPVVKTATASWGGNHPTEGYPVLPLGVGYCTWANNHAAAGTSTEGATHITIRTDTLQAVDNLLSPVTGLLAGILPLDGLIDSLLGTGATAACAGAQGQQLLTLEGGTWISGLAGALLNESCDVKVDIDLTGFVGSLASGLVMPTECTNKFGNQIKVGSTILLPIYVPDSNLQNAGLKLLSACTTLSIGGLLGGSAAPSTTCVEVPPKIGVKIVGFAPFKVTGWNFGYTASPDASAPCPNLSIGLPLRDILEAVVKAIPLLGGTLWALVVAPLLNVLNNGGNLHLAVGCTGIQGYFTKTFTTDPNFQYGSDGLDLGASRISLIK